MLAECPECASKKLLCTSNVNWCHIYCFIYLLKQLSSIVLGTLLELFGCCWNVAWMQLECSDWLLDECGHNSEHLQISLKCGQLLLWLKSALRGHLVNMNFFTSLASASNGQVWYLNGLPLLMFLLVVFSTSLSSWSKSKWSRRSTFYGG